MGGFYTQPGDEKGGTGLPKGHWMHGAMAKEKARLAKKNGTPVKGGMTVGKSTEVEKGEAPDKEGGEGC